jgi:hypothetical protein
MGDEGEKDWRDYGSDPAYQWFSWQLCCTKSGRRTDGKTFNMAAKVKLT